MPTLLGVTRDRCHLPLLDGLEQDPAYSLIDDSLTANAIRLREHDVHAALLSPIDYSRESSNYLVVPGIATISRGLSTMAVLHFREELEHVATLAVLPTTSSEIILARIVLAEEFDTVPSIIPLSGDLDTMLSRADAALLVGETALRHARSHRNQLDLVDMWEDMTDLPFVHALWCTREADMGDDDVKRLAGARDRGVRATTLRVEDDGTSPDPLFSYTLDDEALAGLQEFFRYAYYHGIIPDVPEPAFLGTTTDPPIIGSPASN